MAPSASSRKHIRPAGTPSKVHPPGHPTPENKESLERATLPPQSRISAIERARTSDPVFLLQLSWIRWSSPDLRLDGPG